MSDCSLRDIGQEPLWREVPDGSVQVMRFTFVQGHFAFIRTVRIDTFADGSGVLLYDGEDFQSPAPRSQGRRPFGRIIKRRIELSAQELTKIEELAEMSGTFDHEIGTWHAGDGETIYLHCQTLDMERANAEGYSFSVVNIGCSHPAKLKPLVDEVARLAGMQFINGGQMYR